MTEDFQKAAQIFEGFTEATKRQSATSSSIGDNFIPSSQVLQKLEGRYDVTSVPWKYGR